METTTPIKRTHVRPDDALLEREGLWTPERVAAFYGATTSTLANWRAKRKGPPYIAFGKRVLYRRSAFFEWLNSQEKAPPRRRA